MSLDLVSSPFLTLKEAAAFLRYSPSSLYNREDIPRYKLPGSKDWRYDREELLIWAKSAVPQRLEPKSEPSALPPAMSPEPRKVPRHRTSRYR